MQIISLNRSLRMALVLWSTLVSTAIAAAAPGEFSFGVIAYPFKTSSDESLLRAAITASDADNLAFVVANGIKSDEEPCSDNVYIRRKKLLSGAQNGLVLSLVANDWSDCKKSNGRSAAIERLNRIRELFYVDEFSFGASRIPLMRQSSSPKFRSFGENAHWEVNGLLFATINIPGNNNNYLAAAGRNSEFEDRLIANREWLQRITAYASHKKLRGVVLFCDGNPLTVAADQNGPRDGYLEIRRQLVASSEKFQGKILIIHNQSGSATPSSNNDIKWHGRLGEMSVASGWIKVTVASGKATLFSISSNPAEPKISRP